MTIEIKNAEDNRSIILDIAAQTSVAGWIEDIIIGAVNFRPKNMNVKLPDKRSLPIIHDGEAERDLTTDIGDIRRMEESSMVSNDNMTIYIDAKERYVMVTL